MSWFSDLLSGTKKAKSEQEAWTWTPEQRDIASKLSQYFGSQIGKGLPAYTGRFVAPMSQYEQQGLGSLGQYLSGGPSKTLGTAQDAIQRALTGDYADIVSPESTQKLFSRIKEQTLGTVLPELQDTLAKNVNLSGMYFSGPHMESQRKLQETTGEQLLNTLAQLEYSDEQKRRDVALERERRQLEAVPSALSLSQWEEGAPLRKTAASQTYGALPREIEQATLTSDFTEWLRTQAQNNPILAMALSLLGQKGYGESKGTIEQTDPMSGLFGQYLSGLGKALTGKYIG